MKNLGKILIRCIFGSVILVWLGLALPQSFEHTDEAQYTSLQGKSIEEYATSVRGTVRQKLEEHSTEGFSGDAEYVLTQMYDVLDRIVTEDMIEQDKVRAIHDYLITHADYYVGNLDTRPGWSSAVKGVLLKGAGVCNSYALAFYSMATAAGIDCRVVSGTATNADGTGDHAWNCVKLADTWFYIDCTWDDPIGGGYENYDYYLTASLWDDHEIEEERDPGEESFESWQSYYLTGECW